MRWRSCFVTSPMRRARTPSRMPLTASTRPPRAKAAWRYAVPLSRVTQCPAQSSVRRDQTDLALIVVTGDTCSSSPLVDKFLALAYLQLSASLSQPRISPQSALQDSSPEGAISSGQKPKRKADHRAGDDFHSRLAVPMVGAASRGTVPRHGTRSPSGPSTAHRSCPSDGTSNRTGA